MGDEFRSTVGSDVGRDTVLGEDVQYEELGELGGRDGVMSGNEDGLLGQSVNNDQDGRKAVGKWELFNEVHRD